MSCEIRDNFESLHDFHRIRSIIVLSLRDRTICCIRYAYERACTYSVLQMIRYT